MQTTWGDVVCYFQLRLTALAAPMYWWDWLVAPVLMVRYKEKSHLAASSITSSLMSIYLAGVSKKGNRINPRWRPN
jgi:hypothetical protein